MTVRPGCEAVVGREAYYSIPILSSVLYGEVTVTPQRRPNIRPAVSPGTLLLNLAGGLDAGGRHCADKTDMRIWVEK
jgi:hypothetical protein